MKLDRSWTIQRKVCTSPVSEEFKNGVDDFIKIASRDLTCPCSKCKNCTRKETFWVEKYMYQYGFMEDYINWTIHDEDQLSLEIHMWIWLLMLLFYTFLRDVDEPLWDGCHKHTKLLVVTQLLNLKSEFNELELSKKMVNDLGLGYEKIDACLNHSMLYDKENKDPKVCSICLVCKHPQFKPKVWHSSKEKDVSCSMLQYFPIIPRLTPIHV
ncbi:hypothetical protein CR513_28082, partial [Mucuna pruriens]